MLIKEDIALKRNLISYAYLAKVQKKDSDWLGGIGTIITPILAMKAGEQFEPADFCELVDQLYGIKITSWAAEDLAERFVNSGYLVKDSLTEGTHRLIYAECPADLAKLDTHEIEMVLASFKAFAKETLRHTQIDLHELEIEKMFLEHLVDLDFISIVIKPDRTKEDRRGPSTLSLQKEKADESVIQEITNKSHFDILCSSFVIHLYKNEKALFDFLVKLVSGAILSEVVLNFRQPETEFDLSEVVFVLDTPLLMSLLDLTSESDHAFTAELASLLLDKNAKLAVFSHSLEEMSYNLKAVIHAFNIGEGYRATARRLHNKDFYHHAEVVSNNPETAVKSSGIRVIRSEAFQDSSHQYFNIADEESLNNMLRYFDNPKAAEKDVQSIASIMKLRQGKKTESKYFTKCKYVFITDNSKLSNKASSFCVKKGFITTEHVPPALSQKYISGLAWVLFGGEGTDIPYKLLLSNCVSAMQPRPDVINRMHQFLSGLDEAKATLFNTLMTKERAGQYLMQFTAGDSTQVNESNVEAVLESMTTALIEKERKAHDEQLKQIESKFADTLNTAVGNLEDKLSEVQASFEQKSHEKSLLFKENQKLLADIEERKDIDRKRIDSAFKMGRNARKRMKILLWLFYLVSLILIASIANGIFGEVKYPYLFEVLTILFGAGALWKAGDYTFGYPSQYYGEYILKKDLERYHLLSDFLLNEDNLEKMEFEEVQQR